MRAPILAALAACLVLGAASRPVLAGFDYLKPDLKILSIGPSPTGPLFVRVVVANVGPAWADHCVLNLIAGSPAKYVNVFVPSIAPSNLWTTPTATLDIYLGVSSIVSGQNIFGRVDSFDEVVEKNEMNNTFSYSAS